MKQRTKVQRTIPARECTPVLVLFEPRIVHELRRIAREQRIGVSPLVERWTMERLLSSVQETQMQPEGAT